MTTATLVVDVVDSVTKVVVVVGCSVVDVVDSVTEVVVSAVLLLVEDSVTALLVVLVVDSVVVEATADSVLEVVVDVDDSEVDSSSVAMELVVVVVEDVEDSVLVVVDDSLLATVVVSVLVEVSFVACFAAAHTTTAGVGRSPTTKVDAVVVTLDCVVFPTPRLARIQESVSFLTALLIASWESMMHFFSSGVFTWHCRGSLKCEAALSDHRRCLGFLPPHTRRFPIQQRCDRVGEDGVDPIQLGQLLLDTRRFGFRLFAFWPFAAKEAP